MSQKARVNPRKYLLYRPRITQVLMSLAAAISVRPRVPRRTPCEAVCGVNTDVMFLACWFTIVCVCVCMYVYCVVCAGIRGEGCVAFILFGGRSR